MTAEKITQLPKTRSRLVSLLILCWISWLVSSWQAFAEVIVRVEIANTRSSILLGSSTPAQILDRNDQVLGTLEPLKGYRVQPGQAGVHLNGITNPIVQIQPQGDGLIAVNGRWYKGDLLMAGYNMILGVNYVELEDYVASVVDAEMGASFYPEALKAQAVAARSYVLHHYDPNDWFDVHSDTRHQVYRGLANRSAAALAATEATRGLVLVYGDQFVNAMYSASNGGRTVAVPGVPYFKSLPDVTNHPKYGHGIGLSQWGSQERAGWGWKYHDILNYYYQGVRLTRLPQ